MHINVSHEVMRVRLGGTWMTVVMRRIVSKFEKAPFCLSMCTPVVEGAFHHNERNHLLDCTTVVEDALHENALDDLQL